MRGEKKHPGKCLGVMFGDESFLILVLGRNISVFSEARAHLLMREQDLHTEQVCVQTGEVL